MAATLWLAVLCAASSASGGADSWHFVDRTVAAGLSADGVAIEHGFVDGPHTELRNMSGGAAAGDYDGDGWLDLYVVRGNIGPNLLYRNRGDGTFAEVGVAAGVDSLPGIGCGPLFADLDGDGWLDLFVGGFGPRPVTLFRNRGDGTFEDVSAATGIVYAHATLSAACTDYDFDGDLDLYTSHWGTLAETVGHLWRNNGDRTFTDVDVNANVAHFTQRLDYTFTPNFADINNDGWPDLVIAADFGTSQIYLNTGQGRFAPAPLGVDSPDENGMGAAIGDYDNDGDLDWFVTSIWDFDMDPEGNWGVTGNRMYRNRGAGSFEDVTDFAVVREGDWGWAASFGDLNNDGWLDIYMVNGWRFFQFVDDPARLFVNTADGRFEERGVELGVADTGQGRGLVCFDYDRDGDLDLLVCNNSGPLRLLRNETPGTASFVSVRLVGDAPNTQAVGARVYVCVDQMTQMRELRAGSNYVSSNPVEAHFGLGGAVAIDQLRIVWPDGREEAHANLRVNQHLTFFQTPTAIESSELTAAANDAGILLSWQLSPVALETLRAVHVQRVDHTGAPFRTIASLRTPLAARMSYLDRQVGATTELSYRLVLEDTTGALRVGAALRVDPGGPAPADFELLWARPVADGARIRYRVSGQPTPLTLEVFDVRGRRVATPLRGVRPPGTWTLPWPARSATGGPLPRGLYLVRLQSANASRQVKLVLAPH